MTTNLKEILYPYQTEDSQAHLDNPRLINCSEMGVGKTEVAIRVMEELNAPRNLIVCPSTMVLEWKYRIEKYIDTEVQVPIPYTEPQHQGYRLKAEHFKGRFLVINYEMLRQTPIKKGRPKKRPHNPINYLNVLNLPPWDSIWLDECHRIKNPAAQQSIGAQLLIREQQQKGLEHFHGISGTPFLNYPNELWTMLNLIDPDEYPIYDDFVQEYCYVIPSNWGPRIVGAKKKALPQLRSVMSNLSIRREKKDVMKELPPKSYREIPVVMESKQRGYYDDLEKEMVAYLDSGQNVHAKNGLALSMKLRQWALDPNLLAPNDKLPSVITKTTIDLVGDILSAGEPVVVFSWFASYLQYLKVLLKKKGYSVGLIAGESGNTIERRETQQEFQKGKIQILLGSILTMVGIDLTEARVAIFTDRFWVPKLNEQAEDRLHRRGQHKNVTIIDIVPEESVYQDMHKTLTRKDAAFNETIAIERTMQSLRNRHRG